MEKTVFREMTVKEMQEIEGGWAPIILLPLALKAAQVAGRAVGEAIGNAVAS